MLGLLRARIMNLVHNKLTDWGLSYLTIKADDIILDIGCGGGKTVNKLAKIVDKGKVYGVDISDTSINLSNKLNKNFISEGRVIIQKANVTSLPFPDDYFDIITAIETYFFWPDLVKDMGEVLRILKPGGKLLIVSELYDQTKEQLKETFVLTGYRDVIINDDIKHDWICGIGTKPKKD